MNLCRTRFLYAPNPLFVSLKRGRSPHTRVRERSAAAGGRGGRSEAVGRRPPAERSRPSDRQRSAAGAPCYFEANFPPARRLTYAPGSRQGGGAGAAPPLPVIPSRCRPPHSYYSLIASLLGCWHPLVSSAPSFFTSLRHCFLLTFLAVCRYSFFSLFSLSFLERKTLSDAGFHKDS